MRPEGLGAVGESSLRRSLTLRKEGQEGDVTHQGPRGQRLGGHPSSAHGDRGTGRLCAEGGESHSERPGRGLTHSAVRTDAPTRKQAETHAGMCAGKRFRPHCACAPTTVPRIQHATASAWASQSNVADWTRIPEAAARLQVPEAPAAPGLRRRGPGGSGAPGGREGNRAERGSQGVGGRRQSMSGARQECGGRGRGEGGKRG